MLSLLMLIQKNIDLSHSFNALMRAHCLDNLYSINELFRPNFITAQQTWVSSEHRASRGVWQQFPVVS
jgi:hypothetical protein